MKKQKVKQIGIFILDKSGSMSTIKEQVVSGFNEYLNTIQKGDVDVNFYMRLFDSSSIDKPYNGESIKKVKKMINAGYKPNAMTPLYDAVVSTVEDINAEYEGEIGKYAFSVVIMTDGYENASKVHNEKCLKDLIKKLEKKGNWTFAYMGANQDSWDIASKMGITRDNTMNWESSVKGTSDAFYSLAAASVNHLNMVSRGNGENLSNKSFFSNGGDK